MTTASEHDGEIANRDIAMGHSVDRTDGENAPPADDSRDFNGCDHNRELGQRGERAAAVFLERKGFEILERNWVCHAGEADIIAKYHTADDMPEIHFIEVKTRASTCKGFPEEAVDVRKRRKYEGIAEMYLRDHGDLGYARITFDIISLLVTGERSAFLRMHSNVLVNDCRM